MLANRNAMATIAVKDLAAAKKFYGGTLGLTLLESGEEGVLSYQSGTAAVVVYASQFAGTNQATSCTWGVGGEFDNILKALKAKGVVFEHYDMPGMSLQATRMWPATTRAPGSRTPAATSCISSTADPAECATLT